MDKEIAALKDKEGIDDTPITFGKFKGKTPDEVSEIKPDYIVWMWDNFLDPPCSEALYNFCVRETGKWTRTSGD